MEFFEVDDYSAVLSVEGARRNGPPIVSYTCTPAPADSDDAVLGGLLRLEVVVVARHGKDWHAFHVHVEILVAGVGATGH